MIPEEGKPPQPRNPSRQEARGGQQSLDWLREHRKATMSEHENWIEETGKPAYDSIVEMVEALECDYDRLAELREEWEEWREVTIGNSDPINGGLGRLNESDVTREMWAEIGYDEEAEELAALEQKAGDCENQEDAQDRITEDPLEIQVRGDWHNPGEEDNTPSEFYILLCTGGPAVRIMGELDDNAEPRRAWLEVQDWFKPWTQYFGASQDVLLTYARCFYFGE